MTYIETSVKENVNVVEAFDSLAKKIYSQEHDLKKTQSFLLKSKGVEKRKCC